MRSLRSRILLRFPSSDIRPNAGQSLITETTMASPPRISATFARSESNYLALYFIWSEYSDMPLLLIGNPDQTINGLLARIFHLLTPLTRSVSTDQKSTIWNISPTEIGCSKTAKFPYFWMAVGHKCAKISHFARGGLCYGRSSSENNDRDLKKT